MSALRDNSLSLNTFGWKLQAYLSESKAHRPVPLWSLCDSGAMSRVTYLLTYLVS